jgi:hypothetical protein
MSSSSSSSPFSPPPALRRRSLFHLRVRRGSLGPDITLPVVVLLAPEDADALASAPDAVLADVQRILAQHAARILPSLFFAPPGAGAHAHGQSGQRKGPPGKGAPGGGGGAGGAAKSGGAAAAAAAAAKDARAPNAPSSAASLGVDVGAEAGFAGETTICVFSTRPVHHSYPVMTFSAVGGTMEAAEGYVGRLGPRKRKAGGGEEGEEEEEEAAARERVRGESVASFQLIVRVTHKARQKQRTEAVLAGDPSKLDHFFSSSSSSSGGGGGGGGAAASSSSSSSAAAAASRSDMNADLAAMESMLKGGAGRKRAKGGADGGGGGGGGGKKGKG